MFEDLDWDDQEPLREVDPVEIHAREQLRAVFNRQPQRVYFSRQLEVQNEGHYFHWISSSKFACATFKLIRFCLVLMPVSLRSITWPTGRLAQYPPARPSAHQAHAALADE